MPGRVEVLCGIAGAGKTSRLIDIFRTELRRLLAESAPGQAVWITPTARSRRAIRRTLLDASLGVCFAPNVFTFDQFAERLLQATGLGITPLSGVAQRMIVRTIIDEAVASGSLRYFAPIAETSGFLDLVLGLIAELKRDETEPDEFAKACRKRSVPRDAELLHLYREYQDRLTRLSLYDAEGRFWAARLELAAGHRGAFDPLSLVVVDGFADFTQPQYEIVQHLAGYAQRVLLSLPMEDPVVRTDLFAKSSKAIEEIRLRCTVDLVALATSEKQNEPSSLRHIAERLFGNPRTTPRISDATGIDIVAAAGLAGETRAVAERVKRLLLDGVSAEEIVIGTRSLDEDGTEIASMLSAAGIPVSYESATRFSQSAICRALFAVLQAELQDWSFHSLSTVLRSNYFRPRWNFPCSGPAVETTIRVLRRRQLGADRQHILNRLAKLAEQTESTAKDQKKIQEVPTAARLLQALSDATKRLRSPKDLGGWVDSLFGLAKELGVEPPPRGRNSGASAAPAAAILDDNDRRVWEKVSEVLGEAVRVREILNDRRPMTLAESAKLLRDLFESQSLAPVSSAQSGVSLIEASDVRNLDVPYLFLVGLSEASFPRGRRDDCFYSAAERRQFLRKDGSRLEPSTPQQDEMLLFYSIVTRARRRLTLSYPSVSASGQPLFPSPYVTAVQDLFVASAIQPTPQSDLDPVPSPDRMLSPVDFRLVATDQLRSGRPGIFRTMAEMPTRAAEARGILAATDLDAARFEQRGFTSFEGLLNQGSTIGRLAEKYSPDYQFSATQLERYATCPFRFLLSDVLGLRPNDPMEPEIDPRRRGLALHRVLANLHGTSTDLSSPEQSERTAMVDALRGLVAAQFAVAAEVPAYERALQAAEREFAERFVDLYGVQWEDYLSSVGKGWDELPAPKFVELAFGNLPASDEPTETAAVPLPCVTFGPAESPVRVRGRIDRIDVGRHDGQEVFTVIDYKTRWAPRFQFADIKSGLALQLAIYSSAARRLGILDPDAAAFQMAYWNLTLAGCVVGLKGKSKALERLDAQLLAEIERTLHEVLPKIADRLRAGQFPVINADQDCGRWCPYRTVCRVGQVRSLATERQKLWSVSQQ
jgi:ATP-dependent helicase/nuclease subunit B